MARTMLQTWHVDAAPATQALPASAVALLLEAPQAREPAAQMLAFLNAVVPVDYLSLVAYVAEPRSRSVVPELVEGHAAGPAPNVTSTCFALYRQRFWREDAATRIAGQVEQGGGAPVTALHLTAGDITLAPWRTEIYERAHLADRLSFIYVPLAASAYAINLYRDRARGAFGAQEIERLLAVAPLLRQAHRHALGTPRRPGGDAASVAAAAARLRALAPELSPREREVCARIACGMGADGIAADLDIAPSTVATLRKRAYAKLAARGLPASRLHLATLPA